MKEELTSFDADVLNRPLTATDVRNVKPSFEQIPPLLILNPIQSKISKQMVRIHREADYD